MLLESEEKINKLLETVFNMKKPFYRKTGLVIAILSVAFSLSACGQEPLGNVVYPTSNNIPSEAPIIEEHSNVPAPVEMEPSPIPPPAEHEPQLPPPPPPPAPENFNPIHADIESRFPNNAIVEVDACDLSGDRIPNAKVDIGYDFREYWGYTNEFGQLVEVYAQEIIPQLKEEENSKGRYCKDEAKVPGTENKSFDEGHVIADSLGGVSNAYNITPQDSYLNRHGAQRKMEKSIDEAKGARDFHMIITYPDTSTQTPNGYKVSFTFPDGRTQQLAFPNVSDK